MSCVQADICSVSDEIQEQLCGQPLEVVADSLFVKGMFNKFTEIYGDRDHFYFQLHCTNWKSSEDHDWIERLSVYRFVLMLPHPAHAVLVLSREKQEAFE